MILKYATIQKVHQHQHSQRHVYFQYGLDGDEAREGTYITRKNWDELGQPEVITVTIEAGHKLDAEELERKLLDKIPSRIPQANLSLPSEV